MKTIWRLMSTHMIPVFVGIICVCLFAVCMIGSFQDFYFNCESVATTESMYRYFVANFHFLQLPHFKWHTDWFLYPYGVDTTFLFWKQELCALEAFYHFCCGGYFPTQWYYLLSLVITYFGTYGFLMRRKGVFWAAFFALILTFCNYAAICKFPGHFAHCVVHWMTLSVLLDLITIEKFWQDERFSASFVLIKAIAIVSCLGIELGYIAGIAFCVTFITYAYLVAVRLMIDRSLWKSCCWVRNKLLDVISTFSATKWNWFFLIVLILLGWVYVPTMLQILSNAPLRSGSGVTYVWKTDLLKMFVPILPGFNPSTYIDERVSNVIFAWNAGLSLFFVFLIALTKGFRRNFKMWGPFVFILLALMFFKYVPVLRVFPFFKYVRNSEQFSSFVVVAFMAPVYFACHKVDARQFFQWLRSKEFLLILIPVFLIEVVTAYKDCFLWQKRFPITPFPADYKQAVEYVRRLPGEAIFFLPFSAHGGDGNGMTKYHLLTAHQMQFASVANKKMNGVYQGRLSPTWLKNFNRFNWPYYIGDAVWSNRRWKQFEEFLRNSDFAALIIDSSKLSEEKRKDIISHIGSPQVSFEIFGDHYEVIPLPDQLRGNLNLERIMELRFDPEELGQKEVRFSAEDDRVILEEGFAGREPWGVWSTAPVFSLRVTFPRFEQDAILNICAQAYKKVTAVRVFFNDEPVAEWNVPDGRKREYAVHIPQRFSDCTGVLRFEQKEIVSPHELNPKDGDIRKLGMGLISLSLVGESKK